MSDKNHQSIQEAEEDDDRIQNQHQHQKKKKKRKKGGAKNLILVPFRKFEKLCITRKQRSTRLPPSSHFPSSEDEDFALGKGCHPHLCFTTTRPVPNVKPSSYHDFLRSMIEKNDFYSPESNVHI